MKTRILVVTPAATVPQWAAPLPADVVDEGRLDAALLEQPADAVLVDGLLLTDPLAVARRVHAADPEAQVVLVVSDERRRQIQRTLLFTPGLGEIWLASTTDAGGAIAERAAGVTRQRRQFARTSAQIHHGLHAHSPQRTTRAFLSDAVLAGLSHVLPDAVLTVDASGRIVSANAAAERLRPPGVTQLVGESIGSLLDASADVGSLFGDEIATRDVALAARATDNGTHQRIGELTVVPLRVPQMRLWAAVLHDVTDRELARQQLSDQAAELEATTAELSEQAAELEHARDMADEARRQAEDARRQAEEANAAKSQFLAMMSHELRQPLNAMQGYTDLLLLGLRGPVTDEQREDLERIRRTGQHLLTLINDVLQFARVEAGQIEMRIGPVAVDTSLEDLLKLVHPQMRAKGLRCSYVGAGSGVRVLADPERLRQILLNLVTNAIKFTPEGGTVALRACADPRTVSIVVADTGIGIEKDKLDLIFDPFMQVDRRFSSPQEGVGLGLAISRDLARAMSGDITAVSTPGEGSEFTVVLPRARKTTRAA